MLLLNNFLENVPNLNMVDWFVDESFVPLQYTYTVFMSKILYLKQVFIMEKHIIRSLHLQITSSDLQFQKDERSGSLYNCQVT